MQKLVSLIKALLVFLTGAILRDTRGKVLYYHDISRKYTSMGTALGLFQSHVEILQTKGYKITNSIPTKPKEVMICFDDGWSGIWDYRDYLVKNQIFPTVFIIVDFIGKDGHLSLSQILELQQLGFRFEGHTYGHVSLTTVTGGVLHHELIESRIVLSGLLNKEVKEICFPRGKYSDSLVELALSNGYNKVYICTPGSCEARDTIIRRNLVQGCGLMEFLGVLNGGLILFSKRAERLHHLPD